jgi:hypothetical protein
MFGPIAVAPNADQFRDWCDAFLPAASENESHAHGGSALLQIDADPLVFELDVHCDGRSAASPGGECVAPAAASAMQPA